jgi:hypothetical protein
VLADMDTHLTDYLGTQNAAAEAASYYCKRFKFIVSSIKGN